MEILVLTPDSEGAVAAEAVLPALGLLGHSVAVAPWGLPALVSQSRPDLVLVDARSDLAGARGTCQLLQATGLSVPLIAVVSEGAFAAVSRDWGVQDVVAEGASPAEVAARLRLALAVVSESEVTSTALRLGDLVLEPENYSVKLKGASLDLTYKEFELLSFLMRHPGRVFTRDQLLREVWGFDYFGGTRTVDVHIRRLRAKLGGEYEALIGTVRHVGYRFVRSGGQSAG